VQCFLTRNVHGFLYVDISICSSSCVNTAIASVKDKWTSIPLLACLSRGSHLKWARDPQNHT